MFEFEEKRLDPAADTNGIIAARWDQVTRFPHMAKRAPNSPTANVLAMYETAKTCGAY